MRLRSGSCLAAAAVGLLGACTARAEQPVVTPPPVPAPPAGRTAASPSLALVVEAPYQRTITLQIPGAERVLSVNPSIIEASVTAPGVVSLHAAAFGQTFIHVWTPAGRLTRTVQVVQPPVEQPPQVLARAAAEEAARHLTFEYRNLYRVQGRGGPRLQDTDRTTTTQFNHDLYSQMQLPIGNASGRVGFQRVNSESALSTWSAALTDGRLGPLQRFDVIGGDTAAGYSDLTLPESTLRGVRARYYQWAPYEFDAFYGRRRLGFASGLLPGGETNDDVFFSGGRIQDTVRPWTWSAAYAAASGSDRAEIQTSQAAEFNQWYWLNNRFRVGAQAGGTQDNAYGYRLTSALLNGPLTFDVAYRNFSQRYENLLGRSADQGERGVLATSQFTPVPSLRLRQRIDVYQDTLFRNTEEPHALNEELEWGMDTDLTSSTLWSAVYSRQRLLGRLFPTDATTVTTGLRQRLEGIPLLDHGFLFGDYEFRTLRSVSAPSSDFEAHTLRAGVGAPLTEWLSWQVTQQWTLLEDGSSDEPTRPRETTAGLNYSQRLRRVPLSLFGGLNFSTTSHAGSPNSFLANEDRWSINAGARYDLTDDLDAFVDSRLLRTSRPTGREYDLELQTGVRYFFDTGISWQPSTTVSGVVFQDADGDGAHQAQESGVPRVAVQGGGRRAVTDPGGRFYLGRVRGREVEVALDLDSVPAGYVPTSPSRVVINAAKPPPGPLWFGLVAQSELRARVFIDTQGDGRYDAADVPLEGIQVSLSDGAIVRTDRSGWAFFRGLRPGRHTASMQVADLAAGYVPEGVTSQPHQLAGGQPAVADFPVRAERSISGRVYVDRNRNGECEAEPLLAGIPVCLDGARRAKTHEDGRYVFKGVGAGVHHVELNCGVPLPGYLPLNAVTQTVELPPRPVRMDQADFRLAISEAMLQDIVADVVRARRERERLIEEMIELRRREKSPDQSIDHGR